MIECVIKIYGELETIYVHIKDAGDKWLISHSRWSASEPRVLGMEYDKTLHPSVGSCLTAYIGLCKFYYSV